MTSSLFKMQVPPEFPLGSSYVPCYCEENIFLLAKHFLEHEESKLWNINVIFISNPNKSVLLLEQVAARCHPYIIWDYHVILVLTPTSCTSSSTDIQPIAIPNAWVYDFDTALPKPCSLSDYFTKTFPSFLPAMYRRVIPGQEFVDWLASDRSHMEPGSLCPKYPPLQGNKAKEQKITNNLMDGFVSMLGDGDCPRYGDVYALDTILEHAW